MRDLAKERAARFAAWRQRREEGDDQTAEVNPIDRLTRASAFLSARASDLQKLADAAKPLYDGLDDAQKRGLRCSFTARWAMAIGVTGLARAEGRLGHRFPAEAAVGSGLTFLTPAPLVRQWRVAVACVTIRAGPKGNRMAKGQMRSSKEAKKPKSDKTKNSVSGCRVARGRRP